MVCQLYVWVIGLNVVSWQYILMFVNTLTAWYEKSRTELRGFKENAGCECNVLKVNFKVVLHHSND